MINKSSNKICILTILLFFIIIQIITFSTNYNSLALGLNNKNNDIIIYVGGLNSGNYSNIQDAIDASKEGYTIFVYDDSAPYFENIVISKSINLIGENKDTTIIQGDNSADIIFLNSNNIKISSFTIRNSESQSGIKINSDKDYSCASLHDGNEIRLLKTLKEWIDKLPSEYFGQVHRSTIINFEYIEKIEKSDNQSYKVYLQNIKEPVIMSRRFGASLKAKLKF